jgi:myosin heavy subunit
MNSACLPIISSTAPIFINVSHRGDNMNITITQRRDFMAPYLKAPVKQADAPANTTPSDTIKAQLDAYQKRSDQSRQAIDQLRASEQNMAQWKKADAAEKIQRLKDQIRMLRMMGGIGDAKSNLRQIAQLSKDLAAAAREYASACTDMSAASSTSNTSDAPTKSTETPSEPASGTEDATDIKAGTEQNPQAELKAIAPPQASSVTEADRKFAAEVVNLANQLKSLAKQQMMRLQQSDASSIDGERAKMREAFAEIEKSVTTILTPAEAAPPTINIFA